MAVITVEHVQQWLKGTKYKLTTLDEDLEESARAEAFARLSTKFDTSGWTSKSNTPRVVMDIVSLLVASWEYDRAVSQDAPNEWSTYGDKLARRARGLIEGILADEIDIGEPQDPDLADTDSPIFFPTDSEDEYDALTDEEDHRRKFEMGQVF